MNQFSSSKAELIYWLRRFLEIHPLDTQIEAGVCLWLRHQGLRPSVIEIVQEYTDEYIQVHLRLNPRYLNGYVSVPGVVTIKRIRFVKCLIQKLEKEIYNDKGR